MNPSSILGMVLSQFRGRWVSSLTWAVGLGVVIWYLAGLIVIHGYRPLESDESRMIAIAIIFGVWLIANLIIGWSKRRANKSMIDELTAVDPNRPADPNSASAEEISQLRTRLQEALGLLRKTGGGRRWGRDYLYQLPWYVMIGPPGSGKTTALLTSGLKFPLSNTLGRDPLKGIGGTRNCDWWFTEEAILLDTAGRYTTQDSDPHNDQAAWMGFLNLLKTHRPRQPINGVVIVLSLSDIAARDPSERLSHAQAIRQRLNELYEHFGLRFPVYVLFTKADLIAGFVEYFDAYSKSEREQVWGVTLPLDKAELGEEGIVAQVPSEVDRLIDQMNNQLLERVQQEPDIERRGLIYGFPNQIASLRDSIQELLTEIFRPTRFEQRALLRGVYLASSTQVGTPIDRMMSVMSSAFGIEPQRLPPFPGQGRSYFLTRLFRNVIFAEAAMVSTDPRAERRQRMLRFATYAAAVILVGGLATVWTSGYLANKRLIAEIDDQLATYEKAVAQIPSTDVSDTDIARVVPPLDQLRALPTGLKTERPNSWLTVGLYQGDKLLFQHDAVYHRALNGLFLPRLLTRLQTQLRDHITEVDYLSEGLKVYLMLGNQGPFDKDFVRHWLVLDWSTAFPGPANDKLRADLAQHYDALAEQPLPNIALDAGLIDQARKTLQQVPPANRAYALIKQSKTARDLPEWRIVDHAGPAADQIFARASGKPLTDGIPGIYTYRGFYQGFLPALDNVAHQVEAERWVRGGPAGEDGTSDRFQHDVLALYLNDYASQWQSLLADIQLVPAANLDQAIAELNLLSGPDSPLSLLLKGIARETNLGKLPTPADGAKPDEATQRLAALLGAQAGGGQTVPTAQLDQKFRGIQDLVTSANGAPAPIDDLTRNLGNVYQQLSHVSRSPVKGQAMLHAVADGSGDSGVQQMAADARRLPAPLDGWVGGMADNVSSISVGGARSQLGDLWDSEVRNFCSKATYKRYPLFKDSASDMPLDDFTKLFAPNGLMDAFFNAHLKPLVDTSRQPWRWQHVEGSADLGISAGVLAEFQHAAAIRDAFFQGNGGQPLIHFELTPVDLDASTTEIQIDVDGQTTDYRHGPLRPTPMQWPSPQSGAQTRISFSSPSSGQSSSTNSGPWALFRLFDGSQMEPGASSDSFRVTFAAGGKHATYDVRTSSVLNPFNLKDLRQFRCPTSF
jgi:type VI secretion system protein ImpL